MDTESLFRYDAYVSYSKEDQEWVLGTLVARLEEDDITICVDDRHFTPGAYRLTEIERAVQNSRRILLVITPAYTMSEWTETQSVFAQSDDAEKRLQRTIPVVVKQAVVPLRLAALTPIDLTRLEQLEFQLARLIGVIAIDPWDRAKRAYGQADATYRSRKKSKTSRLSHVIVLLTRAEGYLSAAADLSSYDARELGKKIRLLRRRVEQAQIAFRYRQRGDLGESLRILHQLKQGLGEEIDPVLNQMIQQYGRLAREQVRRFLDQSDVYMQEGDYRSAFDYLDSARQLYQRIGQEELLDEKIARLQRLIEKEEIVRVLEFDIHSKMRTDSRKAAFATMGDLLRIMSDEESQLTNDIQEVIHDLLNCEGKLNVPDIWERTEQLHGKLKRAYAEKAIPLRIINLVSDWLSLGRRIEIAKIIATAEKLEQFQEAYVMAKKNFDDNKQDPDAVETLQQAREVFTQWIRHAALKWFARAQKALEEGIYQIVLANLNEIDQKIIGATGTQCPELFEDVDSLERLRWDVSDLRRKAEFEKNIHEIITPLLDAARKAFLDGDYDSAEKNLNRVLIEDPSGRIKQHQSDVRSLLESISTRREKIVNDSNEEILFKAETQLIMAVDLQRLAQIRQNLEKIPAHGLKREHRDWLNRLLDQLKQALLRMHNDIYQFVPAANP